MPDTRNEQEAAKLLLVKIHEIKADCFDAIRHVLNLDESKLLAYGYKSHIDGVQYKFKMANAKVNDAIAAHEKLYPK